MVDRENSFVAFALLQELAPNQYPLDPSGLRIDER